MCVGAVALVLAGHAVAADGSYKLAITIDDLPSHGALPAGMTRSGIAKMTLDAYASHKVPRVYGYINAVHLKGDPDNALDPWRHASATYLPPPTLPGRQFSARILPATRHHDLDQRLARVTGWIMRPSPAARGPDPLSAP